MNNELKDYFIQGLIAAYEAPYSLAAHLYERWNVKRFTSNNQIDEFVNSPEVKKVVFTPENINTMKRYSLEELKQLGLSLSLQNPETHIFEDSQYGYKWKQVSHGEILLDLYRIIAPVPDESGLV